MRTFGIFLLLLAGGATAAAPSPVTRRLLVVSYNIKGLPGIFTSSEYQNPRYGIIGKLLAARYAKDRSPEIVLIQEGFSEHTRSLLKAAAFPHVAQGPEFKTWVGLDSGLYILSQHPIVATARREFKAYPNCSGWDCFANKGVQFARIAVPGLPRPLEIFNTHLQAGRENPPARLRQVRILVEFFKEHHVEGNPVIFGGDFNLRPLINREAYDEFVAGTGLVDSGKVCLERGCARSPDSGWQGIWENAVDHQFFSASGPVLISPRSVERTYAGAIEGYRLSDHLAHETEFELRFTGPGPQADGASPDPSARTRLRIDRDRLGQSATQSVRADHSMRRP